jgi:hypothetical protein
MECLHGIKGAWRSVRIMVYESLASQTWAPEFMTVRFARAAGTMTMENLKNEATILRIAYTTAEETHVVNCNDLSSALEDFNIAIAPYLKTNEDKTEKGLAAIISRQGHIKKKYIKAQECEKKVKISNAAVLSTRGAFESADFVINALNTAVTNAKNNSTRDNNATRILILLNEINEGGVSVDDDQTTQQDELLTAAETAQTNATSMEITKMQSRSRMLMMKEAASTQMQELSVRVAPETNTLSNISRLLLDKEQQESFTNQYLQAVSTGGVMSNAIDDDDDELILSK